MTRQTTESLRRISPDRIKPNPENPRIFFRAEELDSLLYSISTQGIQVPITVYKEEGEYVLIDGERRWKCALKLNLRNVPALVRRKPTPLENLLLMYNIHALREQWDYFTIAAKLPRVMELFVSERGVGPNESELSEATGLSRGQIRRCRLLLDLPDKYKQQLQQELHLPKSRQRLSEDLFIEMEKALKTVQKRFPRYTNNIEEVRDTLVEKYRIGIINSVTEFRFLAKIGTAIDNIEVREDVAARSLDRIFERNSIGIKREYERRFELQYDEKKAVRQMELLEDYVDSLLEVDQTSQLDQEFLNRVRQLYEKLRRLLSEFS